MYIALNISGMHAYGLKHIRYEQEHTLTISVYIINREP